MEWRERDGVRWLEAELPGAAGGLLDQASAGSARRLREPQRRVKTGDERGSVVDNRRRLCAALGLAPEHVVIGPQVHGAELAGTTARRSPAPSPSRGARTPRSTATPPTSPASPPLVFVADCLPVALAGPGGVAIAHGGWRGLAGGILARGAAAVGAEAAAIGPGIGPCCYEVGDEVLAEFAALGGGDRRRDACSTCPRSRAPAAGAAPGSSEVESAELCTSCNPDLFFSHRRDGERTGRQAGLAWRWREAERCPG